MRFYEQVCKGRTVISDQIEPDAKRVTRDVDAACWIEAKKRLGYLLSATQECLLGKFYEDRERAMKRGITAI